MDMIVIIIVGFILVSLIIVHGVMLFEALMKTAKEKLPQPKTMEDLSDELCDYCPLDDCQKGTHETPNGYYSCEGCRCEEAYENYIEQFTDEL